MLISAKTRVKISRTVEKLIVIGEVGGKLSIYKGLCTYILRLRNVLYTNSLTDLCQRMEKLKYRAQWVGSVRYDIIKSRITVFPVYTFRSRYWHLKWFTFSKMTNKYTVGSSSDVGGKKQQPTNPQNWICQ